MTKEEIHILEEAMDQFQDLVGFVDGIIGSFKFIRDNLDEIESNKERVRSTANDVISIFMKIYNFVEGRRSKIAEKLLERKK